MAKISTEAALQEFEGTRYWPALDGLRAVSILGVLLVHTSDRLWEPLNGQLGVTLFFVISGFLITTLLVREERRVGRASLPKFYVRRFFRIAPLYFLALGLASVMVLGFGLGEHSSNFLERLPLLATFNGEFAGLGTFGQSWSLGIEEKFYILWPLLAFASMFARSRRTLFVVLMLPVMFAANFIPGLGYLGIYFSILAGCALALMAHHPRGFRYYHALTTPLVAGCTFFVMVAAFLIHDLLPFEEQSAGMSNTVFAVAATLALPGILRSGNWAQKFFGAKPIAHFGTCAYAIYLFHPGIIEVVDRILAPGQTSLAVQVARLVMIVGASFGLAEVLRRLVEGPMIKLGRRLTSAPASDGEPHVLAGTAALPRS